MRLHEDSDAFSELVQAAAEKIGLPQVYVEKDYWVTKALKHLSESNYLNDVVFKGGTSLSKGYRLIDRFSEDIDLAAFAGHRVGHARKQILRKVEKVVSNGLTPIEDILRQRKNSNFRKTVYRYPRTVEDANFGQASPELLLEINAFTNPEPFELLPIQSLISDALIQQDRQDLIEEFSLKSFSINVLSVKRTLVEKMLGSIKDSYHKNPAEKISDRIRHLYDICLILRDDQHREFVKGDEFAALCDSCIEDEKTGVFKYSECLEKPLVDAPLFYQFADWRPRVEATYNGVFSDLVYGQLPSMDEIVASFAFLHENLKK